MLNSFFHRSELPDERRRSRSESGNSIAGGDSPSSIDQPQQQPGLKPAAQIPPEAVEGSSDPADWQPDNDPAESGQRPVDGDRLRSEVEDQDVQDFEETDHAEVDERDAEPSPAEAASLPPWLGGPPKRRGRQLVKPSQDPGRRVLTPEQRLLVLDSWKRSGLPAGDFAALVGVSKHTLYSWKKRFDALGPAGLMDQPRGGPRGSKLPEVTKRTILMLKENNPEWGCQRISDMLQRGPALPASPTAGCSRSPATRWKRCRLVRTRTRLAASSGPSPTSSGRRTCLRSCSSGRTAGSEIAAFAEDVNGITESTPHRLVVD